VLSTARPPSRLRRQWVLRSRRETLGGATGSCRRRSPPYAPGHCGRRAFGDQMSRERAVNQSNSCHRDRAILRIIGNVHQAAITAGSTCGRAGIDTICAACALPDAFRTWRPFAIRTAGNRAAVCRGLWHQFSWPRLVATGGTQTSWHAQTHAERSHDEKYACSCYGPLSLRDRAASALASDEESSGPPLVPALESTHRCAALHSSPPPPAAAEQTLRLRSQQLVDA